MPVTPRPSATVTPRRAATSMSFSLAFGAGAMTSAQTPSRCTVSATGYATTSPEGRRATCWASSRVNETSSSTSSGPSQEANQSATSEGSETTRTPLPS